MNLWIFDTDHISLWQTNHPTIRQRLLQTDPKTFAVTVISFEEQIRGRLGEINRITSRKQRIRIGTRDLRIASIALSVNSTIVTRNRRDFEQGYFRKMCNGIKGRSPSPQAVINESAIDFVLPRSRSKIVGFWVIRVDDSNDDQL